MDLIQKAPIWLLVLYQLVGYISLTLLGQPPFFVFFVVTVASVAVTYAKGQSRKIPSHLFFLLLSFLFMCFSVFIYNGIPLGPGKFLSVILGYLASFLILYHVYSYPFSKAFVRALIVAMRFTVILAAFVSIVQYFVPDFLVFTDKYSGIDLEAVGYERRIVSIFTWGDGMTSQYLGIGMLAMYAMLLFEKESRRRYAAIIVLAVGITVFLSQARFAMVNYLMVTLFWIVSTFPSKQRFSAVVVLIVMLLAFNLLVDVLDFDFGYFVTNRIESDTYMTRIDAIYAAIDQIPENILWGSGGIITDGLYRFYGRLTRIHNGYLGLWYFYGLFAAFSYYTFLLILCRQLIIGARKTHYWGSVVAMSCFLFANFTTDKTTFIDPGLVIMMIFHYYYIRKYERSKLLHFEAGEGR